MCGIVGYVGARPAAPLLLEGLAKLEYRGYDSAGIALAGDHCVDVYKYKGRLSVLAERLNGGEGLTATTGIGHTRWATHGRPSDRNSHPHLSAHGVFAVVHNGIIENYAVLKAELLAQGVPFVSETDTEVIAQLLEQYYTGDFAEAIEFNRQAMEYDDEDPATLDNVAQMNLFLSERKSDSAEKQSLRDMAKEYFKKAHELKPDQVTTIYYLARMEEEDGNIAEALSLVREGLSMPITSVCPVTRPEMEEYEKKLAGLQ